MGKDEFKYTESSEIGRGKHFQGILYRVKEVGYLISKEKNILTPIEETHFIPDVKKGLSDEGSEGLLKGKLGWIDFKRFNSYKEAFEYAKANFDDIVYLCEFGDSD